MLCAAIKEVVWLRACMHAGERRFRFEPPASHTAQLEATRYGVLSPQARVVIHAAAGQVTLQRLGWRQALANRVEQQAKSKQRGASS